MLARKLGQSIGLFARFQKEGFWREEAEHRFALLRAPVEIEGNSDGADFGEREEGFEMLGAAAAGEADQVAFADILSEQAIRQPIGAFVEFAIGQRSVRVDDGVFVEKCCALRGSDSPMFMVRPC